MLENNFDHWKFEQPAKLMDAEMWYCRAKRKCDHRQIILWSPKPEEDHTALKEGILQLEAEEGEPRLCDIPIPQGWEYLTGSTNLPFYSVTFKQTATFKLITDLGTSEYEAYVNCLEKVKAYEKTNIVKKDTETILKQVEEWVDKQFKDRKEFYEKNPVQTPKL